MNLQTKKILGINVTTSPSEEILEEIRKYFQQSTINNQQSTIKRINPFIIFTPNPEIISYAQKDDDFMRIVNTAQINLPDGAGIVWAVKKLHGIEIERIAGIDFMLKLINLAARQRLTIGLIGGRGDLAVRVRECLLSKHKNLKIETFDAPDIVVSRITYHESRINKNIRNTKYLILNTTDNDKQTEKYFQNLVEKIIKKKMAILFVALGFPKQEYFIDRIRYHVSSIKYDKPLILMAVGGAFDYISGRVPRAPMVIRNSGFEWLFRLLREPWRLPRQLKGASFFWRIINS